MSDRHDYVLLYHEERRRTVNMSIWLALASLLILTLSRSPKFGLTDPFGVIAGEITSGYLVVFGPVILFAFAAWYRSRLHSCILFREAILKWIRELDSDDLSPVETKLLASPHDGQTQVAKIVFARYAIFTAFVAVFFLVYEFLCFRNPKSANPGFLDPIVGHPFTGGFDPEWDRAGSNPMPWIYPPWYGMGYLAILLLLFIWLITPSRISKR